MKIAILATLLAAASAFQAPLASKSSTALHESKADLEVLAGKLNPLVKFYDPLNLAEAEFWGASNEATIGFLRHAEIKHGRVAMFAFVGYIAHANGLKWPWAMQMDGSPFPTETNPPQLWDSISDSAKWQIFLVIGFLEFWSELSTPQNKHYMAGGRPGDFPDFTYGEDGIPHPVPFNFYDPFKFSKNMSPEKSEKGLLKEINNGRLAMIGILGFLSEQTTPGSVPLLKGVVAPYAGEVMAPFNTNVIGMPFGL
ncbi:hypothetical protein TrCOL_g4424 [Triparma columacea]|uniref:Uncharacterized protein n=1 Tax=Triparma columacea TaxID=722753 RepID=A0A9W7L6L0_9STRA|nr:hypothetical protein TrCOL_g4424 [Triparma columacea]